MRLRETAIHWMDGTPAHDRARFRRLANLVASCFDSCLDDLDTEHVGKVNTALWSRRGKLDYTVTPERNDRNDTVVTVDRAVDPADLLARTDAELLDAVLAIHLDTLVHVAERRGWEAERLLRAADCVRSSGWEAGVVLPEKVSPHRADLVAHAGGRVDIHGGRAFLAVHDRSGRELQRVETEVPADWHSLRAALYKIVWADPGTVELQPRQRAGVGLGPRLRINVAP
jgi:hypothetical protein